VKKELEKLTLKKTHGRKPGLKSKTKGYQKKPRGKGKEERD